MYLEEREEGVQDQHQRKKSTIGETDSILGGEVVGHSRAGQDLKMAAHGARRDDDWQLCRQGLRMYRES